MYSQNNVIEKWEYDRNKHPFVGEGFSDERIFKCWDDCADTYTGNEYSDIRDEIITDLLAAEILSEEFVVLDIGCGPGLFAIPFSRYCRKTYCVDSSIPMLESLGSKASDIDQDKLKVIHSTWEDMEPIPGVNVAFTSLCPALNNPESLLRMEDFASDYCIYVSSYSNDNSIGIEIWNRLGKDYSFKGYNTDYPFEFLCTEGRDPFLKTYVKASKVDIPLERMRDSEVRRMSQYRDMTPELKNLIESVVMEHQNDGNITVDNEIKLGLLIWKP